MAISLILVRSTGLHLKKSAILFCTTDLVIEREHMQDTCVILHINFIKSVSVMLKF